MMRDRIHFKGFILTFLGFATSLSLSAQSLKGARVLSGTLTTGFFTDNGVYKRYDLEPKIFTAADYSIRPHVSYGRINQKNVLVAYGVAAGFDYYRRNETLGPDTTGYTREEGYMLSPTLTLQKYIALSPQLYYTPSFDFHIGYGWNNRTYNVELSKYSIRMYDVGADFNPLGFTYVAKPNLFLSVGLGNASLGYSNTETRLKSKSGFETERRKDNDFTFGTNTAYFTFGIQKILFATK